MDVQTIMTGRGCIIGQSGSGKSFLAGVIAEELCKANMPFCVIDTEGEYSSLRSQFDVIVLGGSSKDVGLDVDYYKLFHSSIINEVPVILDVSDSVDSLDIVNRALESLYSLESKIRKPYLVLIEEADKFAPQTMSKGANIVEEIGVRGRKRGIGLLVATQRPAKISKNVLSQCSYGFVGKLTIENDLSAIKILFEERSKLTNITKLDVGEFESFGLGENDKFKVKQRDVKHIGMTPTVGLNKPINNKLGKIIKDLAGDGLQKRKRPISTEMCSIYALPMSLTPYDVDKYAKKIAKKRFLMLGKQVEDIEDVGIEYVPLGLCTIRIPTAHRNEYLEYHALLNDDCRLVKIENGIRYATEKENSSKKGRIKYLEKHQIGFEKIDAGKEDILKGKINERKAVGCIKMFFPDSELVEFKLAYLPVYKITLRSGNKVRVFKIDGVHGKDFVG